MKTESFVYEQAFDRNIGWLTSEEQKKLRDSCVAIAGLGGTGGYQAQALARLGVSRFHIADPDYFEMTNINRQLGAAVSTIGKSKVEVIEKMILDINPEAQVTGFSQGIHKDNLDSFFNKVDFAIDGIDFFAMEAKKLFFEGAYLRKIPALTCAPIGFGATLILFSPDGMRYADYFDLKEGMDDEMTQMYFAYGLSPAPLALSYLQRGGMNIKKRRASSVVAGLALVGAISAAEAVKVLTSKWTVRYAPHVLQLDLLTQAFRRRYYYWGMKGPLQRLKRFFFIKVMKERMRDEN